MSIDRKEVPFKDGRTRGRTDGGDDLSDGADSDTPDSPSSSSSSSFFRSRFDSIIVGVFDGNDATDGKE